MAEENGIYDRFLGSARKKWVAASTAVITALGAGTLAYSLTRPTSPPEPPCPPGQERSNQSQGATTPPPAISPNNPALASVPNDPNKTRELTLQIVRDAVSLNEIGLTPDEAKQKSLPKRFLDKIYSLSNAGYGSGYSFGRVQFDLSVHYNQQTHTEDQIGTQFQQILVKTMSQTGLTMDNINAIMQASHNTGTQPVIEKFKPQINQALMLSQDQVDAMDNAQFLNIADRLTRIMAKYVDKGIFSPEQYGTSDNVEAQAIMAILNNQFGAGALENTGQFDDTMQASSSPNIQDVLTFVKNLPFYVSADQQAAAAGQLSPFINLQNNLQIIASADALIPSMKTPQTPSPIESCLPSESEPSTPSATPSASGPPSPTASASASPLPSASSAPSPSPSPPHDVSNPVFYIGAELNNANSATHVQGAGIEALGTAQAIGFLTSIGSDMNNVYFQSPNAVSPGDVYKVVQGTLSDPNHHIGALRVQTLDGPDNWNPQQIADFAELTKGHETLVTVFDGSGEGYIEVKEGAVIPTSAQQGTPSQSYPHAIMMAGDGLNASGQTLAFSVIYGGETPGAATGEVQQFIHHPVPGEVPLSNVFITEVGSITPQQVNNSIDGIQERLADNGYVRIQVPQDAVFPINAYAQELIGPNGALHGFEGTINISNGNTQSNLTITHGQIQTASSIAGAALNHSGVQQLTSMEVNMPREVAARAAVSAGERTL